MLRGHLTDVDTSTQSRVHRRGSVFPLVVLLIKKLSKSRLFIYACLLILRNEHFSIEASLVYLLLTNIFGQTVFEILLFSLILGFGLVGHLTQTSSFHVIRRRQFRYLCHLTNRTFFVLHVLQNPESAFDCGVGHLLDGVLHG